MQGQRVTADDEQAAIWFSKAAEQGDANAQQNGGKKLNDQLRELANLMTAGEIAEAERMATKRRPHMENATEDKGDLRE